MVKVFMLVFWKDALYGALRRLALLDEKKPTQHGTTDIAWLRTAFNPVDRYALLALAFDAVGVVSALRINTLARIGSVCRRSTMPATDCKMLRTASCVALSTII